MNMGTTPTILVKKICLQLDLTNIMGKSESAVIKYPMIIMLLTA